MQAKKRYILVFLSCAFLALCYFGGHRLKQWFLGAAFQNSVPPLDCYMEDDDVMERRVWSSPKQLREDLRANTPKERCRMETCFDFSRCDDSFKVYVYPIEEESATLSSTYRKILNVVMESR
jgi:glucuronyl/N-acetylglucosaminyl transferase EXT1